MMDSRKQVELLLIEDDYDDIEFFTETLGQVSTNVFLTTIEDGYTAFKMLKEKVCSPDFIFLDLKLPVLDGFELLQMIRNEPALQNIPVIVHSGISEQNVIDKCRELGVNTVLAKSNTDQGLIKSIQHCLNSKV